MFDRLAIATDLTQQSSGAFRIALRMSSPRARIVVVHVLDMPPVLTRWANPKLSTDVSNYRSLLQRQVDAARQRLTAQVATAGLELDRTEVIVRVGNPSTQIAAAADRHRAEAILIGRGAGGRLGPVAESVVRLSGRTVVVAPVPRPAKKQRALPSSHRRRGRLAA